MGHGQIADELMLRMAREQFGLFNVAQARAAGLNRSLLDARIRRCRYIGVLPGVFAVAGAPRSAEQDLMAGMLWAGEPAAAAGPAAGWRLGFRGFSDPPVEVATVSRKRCTGLALPDGTSVRVHRVDHHLIPEIIEVDGLPVTSVRRTLLDLAGAKDYRVERALDHALARNMTMTGPLCLYLEQEWQRRRRGIAILRELVAPRTKGQAPTDSDLEAMMRRLLDRERLPQPLGQHPETIPSGNIHIDLAYPDVWLAIELDGYWWHMSRAAFERDRDRDNELRAKGWTVFRFTWLMLKHDPARVAALVRDHLQQNGAI